MINKIQKQYHLTYDQVAQLIDEYNKKYQDFDTDAKVFMELKPFAVASNVFESGQNITDGALFIMRWIAGMKMSEILDILKFDQQDPNIMQDISVGNIGSAQRWAKTICGCDTHDDSEVMSGRYMQPVRLATFPNYQESNIPITKRVDISSVCAHHFLPYGTLLQENSFAVISYIPNTHVLGISKLQRLADFVSRRPSIQEDLAQRLWEVVAKAADTEDVYVGIFNTKHTCEFLRGAQTNDGSFTTEYYRGKFNNGELRQQILMKV